MPIVPERVNLHFGASKYPSKALHLFKNGAPFDVDEDKAAAILENEDIFIHVNLNLGDYESSLYTCDLSHEYISINADYRS